MLEEYLTRQQFWGNYDKSAEASNTELMPVSGKKESPTKDQLAVIPKTAQVEPPEGVAVSGVPGTQPEKQPQAKLVSPRVDVTSKEPPKLIKEKEAQAYALPSQRRYPLDSYSDVEKAASYYATWGQQFSPAQRREYCSNLVKRASVLGVSLDQEIQKYGSANYASSSELEIAIAGRMSVLSDDTHRTLLSKVAEQRAVLPPEDFATLLGEFDKTAGIEHLYSVDILDPYFSTFGVKVAAEDEDGSYSFGNDYVTKAQLKALAASKNARERMDAFSEDLVADFRKHPIDIFESLPTPQKKLIARIANDMQSEH